jgi:hypothetical protein
MLIAVLSNPGGTDAAAVWAWKAALNQTSSFTPDFNGLLDFDLMSKGTVTAHKCTLTRKSVADTRGTFSSNELNVSFEAVAPLLAS